MCDVLDTAIVGGIFVTCGPWGLLGVPEVVWTPRVPLTALVGLLDIVVRRSDVERCCVVSGAEVVSVENKFWVWVVISASWTVVV